MEVAKMFRRQRAKMIPSKFFFLAVRLEHSYEDYNGDATNEETKVGPKLQDFKKSSSIDQIAQSCASI